MKQFLLIVTVFLLPFCLNAQFIEDALRYSQSDYVITPRASALGISYMGIADDNAAIFYNPAGTTLINETELSIGFGFRSNNTETNFLSKNESVTANNQFLTHAAATFNIEMYNLNRSNYKAVFNIGYFLEKDFNSNSSFSAINPTSTMIAANTYYGPSNIDDNWAYNLYLNNLINNRFETPFTNDLLQEGSIIEKGGLHNVIGGFAFNIGDNFSVGANIVAKFGGYDFNFDFKESDFLHKYKDVNIDNHIFSSLYLQDYLKQNVSGVSGSLGFLYKYENLLRISSTLKLPTWYSYKETFGSNIDAYYTNNESLYFDTDGISEYSVRTPFIYLFGASVHYNGLTFTSAIEYTDMTQLEFSNAHIDVMNLNKEMNKIMTGQLTWGVGFEYGPDFMPLVLRGSYTKVSSPYKSSIIDDSKSIIGLGIGTYINEKTRIDAVYQNTSYNERRLIYSDPQFNNSASSYDVRFNPFIIALSLTYRI